MREINKIAEALFEKIRDRFEDVSLGDENAKATTNPEDARFFNFDYSVDGIGYGNVTLSVIDETSLKVYFSKNISKQLEDEQRKDWYLFLRELREFARRNLLSFEPRDITRSTLKHRDLQQVSKSDSTYSKDEVIGEGRMYGTSRSSYENDGNVRLIVRHTGQVDPERRGDRSRKIKSIYVETAEGERFKLPHNNLRYARAMARHVSEGGTLMDDFGQHITRIAEECGKLRPFKSSMRRRTFEDQETQAMVEAAFEYHGLLNNTLKRMSGRKGYAACKESFHADETLLDDFDVDSLRERFVKRTYNERMEDALPIVHKAYEMKKSNKFAEQFESWANEIAEGWNAEPIDVNELADLLSDPIPFGVDAINATAAIEGIIESDEFINEMQKAAQEDPEADARDFIMFWLEENEPETHQQLMSEIGDQEPDDQYGASGMDEPNVNEDDEDLDEMIDPSLAQAIVPGVMGAGAGLAAGHAFVKNMLNKGKQKQYKAEKDFKKSVSEEYDENTYDDDNVEAIQTAILRRILGNINQHSELLKAVGPEGVMNAARDVASFHAPVDELGSSDISIMVREVYQEAGVEYPELNEGRVKELEMDLKELTDAEFVAKYKKTKAEMKAGLSEGNLRVARSDQRKNREAKYYDWLAKNADDFEHYADADIEENVGDDYVNKKEKLAKAGAHRAPRQPEQSFMDKVKSTAKGAKAWVQGKDDSMYESEENDLAEMRRLAGLK
jgi:hypothetical protein